MKKLFNLTTTASIRSVLAVLWSLASIHFINYILIKFGSEKEILTLIIGLIGGTVIGAIFGTYFGGTYRKQQDQQDANLHG